MHQGEIGVLDRTAMDAFADIFIAYQKRGKTHDPKGKLFPTLEFTGLAD